MIEFKSRKERLTYNDVYNYVRKAEIQQYKYMKLKNLYDNENTKIKHKVVEDTSRPNNKISVSYPSFIVDNSVGYFLGGKKPITYSFGEYDEELAQVFQEIHKYNDDSTQNVEVGKSCAVYGSACQMLWIDNDTKIRYTNIPIEQCVFIHSCDLENELIGFIRFWNEEVDEQECTYMEYYTKTDVTKFYADGEGNILNNAEPQEHFWGQVPVVYFMNDSDASGELAKLEDVFDGINQVLSECRDNQEMFANCILKVAGVSIDNDVAEQIRTMRLINSDEPFDAEYIVKPDESASTEVFLQNLIKTVHKLSGVIDLSDSTFLNQASGISLQMQLSLLEFKTSQKENHMRKALLRRCELILHMMSLLGQVQGDVADILSNIDITFKRNVVNVVTEQLDNAIKASSVISKRSVLSMLDGIIDNVDEELNRLQEEKEESISFMQDNFDAHNPQYAEDEEKEPQKDKVEQDKEQDKEDE